MGQDDRFSRIAGRWVRRAWRDAPPHLPAAPRPLVGLVERELRSRRRRRAIARGAGRTLVAAAGLAAVAGLILSAPRLLLPGRSPTGVAVEARRETTPAPPTGRDRAALVLLPGGQTVEGGTHLDAPEANPIRIGSADGTELTVEPAGSLAVVEAGDTKRFALLRGAVRSRVKKLPAGERFIVDTADAEIEVHGTAFRVALVARDLPCRQGTTRVSVTEGVVTVTWSGHEERLFPGDVWPAGCPIAAAPARRLRPPRSVRAAAVAAPRKSGARDQLPSSATPPSVLEAQNDLFSSAVRARRAGRTADARQLFDRFIRSYPDSSLLESAFVQEMRLLATSDPPAAADIGLRYLALFPDGFARAEARALVTAAARP